MINSPPATVSLAKSAEPDAIARYLNEKLSYLGIRVKVFIQIIQKKDEVQTVEFASNDGLQASDFTIISSPRRLWVICDTTNSPDPSMLAEPVAQHLRILRLEGFRDAVVRAQAKGETNPDWFWRIDLTPPEEMVKDWARWGDVSAIALLLNQTLTPQGIEVRVVIKDLTLHLFCSLLTKEVGFPDRQLALAAIAPLLESLAPQGIHAAKIYALVANNRSTAQPPAWVEWLNLPASIHPALAPTALTLAQQGDRDALIFLLQRLVNPDLDRRLATGGIRITLKHKQDLLHIMSEAVVCPLQRQVAPQIAKFLSQIEISNVAGVRIYGRRAGQSSPVWNYGIDFVNRNVSTSESLLAAQNADSVGVTQNPQNRNSALAQQHPNNFQSAVKKRINDAAIILQQWLCLSQLFIVNTDLKDAGAIPHTEGMEISGNSQAVKVAGVWAMLGLLLTIQADWFIGYILRSSQQLAKVSQLATTAQQVQTQAVATAKKSDLEAIDMNPLPQLSLQKSRIDNSSVFNGKGFTGSNKNSFTSDRQSDPQQPLDASKQAETSTLGVTSSGQMSASSLVPQDIAKNNPTKLVQIPETDNPSFNNSLLDQKLALYQQICATSGTPDILIVGSSRALRGVDPAALKAALAAKGYGDLSVFNFGINGATNQVVDFMIRRLLTKTQLPKLIIWADGARSFNSGRVDLTYSAIAASDGFQQLLAGNWSPANINDNSEISDTAKKSGSGSGLSSQSVNNWLNEILGKISTTYPLRDRLKTVLSQQYASIIPTIQQPSVAESNTNSPETSLNVSNFDVDGFLPLSIRFQPTTYYQRYAKVSGDYDNDYDSFELNGQQDIALAALGQFLQERQIPLVFVNMPLTKQYLDPVRQKYEVQFINYIQQQQQENKLILQDLSLLWPNQNQLFSDPSHLNRYGAFEVSQELVQNSMIPWPKK
ncbi:MAG TPA: hypothetical protein V6D15_14670 [Oculatellaceae cyanobacterium]|jgi:hypothetical protein